MARIFFRIHDWDACGWYRMLVPGTALQMAGHEVELADTVDDQALAYYDVFVLQRQGSAASLRLAKDVVDRGKTLVAEIDDDLWHLPKEHALHEHWLGPEDGEPPIRRLEEIAGLASVVTVSTEPLAEVVRRFADRVVVLPNQLPGSRWRGRHEPRPDGTVVLGWAGGPTHGQDLGLIRGAITQVLGEHDDVELQVSGMCPDWLAAIRGVRRMPARMIENYPNVLAEFDVGLGPLTDTVFNRSKSDLKFIEYGMAGVVPVMSNVGPYAASIRHGETGFLCANDKDWLAALTKLIADRDLRKGIADAAHAVAAERTIEEHVREWEEAYGIA